MIGWPVNAGHCSIQRRWLLFRKNKFLCEPIAFSLTFLEFTFNFFFDEEIFIKFELFLAKSAFNNAGTFGEKIFEALLLDNLFCGIIGQNFGFFALNLLLSLTFLAQTPFNHCALSIGLN